MIQWHDKLYKKCGAKASCILTIITVEPIRISITVLVFKDTDLDTAAHATRASSVNNLTSYF